MKRATLVLIVLLAGCGPAGADETGRGGLSAVRDFFARLFHSAPKIVPSPHYMLGAPYQAGGVWYYPAEQFNYQASGLGMVDPPGHGPLTADGELYDPNAMAAAHPTLQLPAIARVTNLETGREVVLRLNDRGPANPGRVLSLTPRAAQLLGVTAGVAELRVTLETAESEALAAAMPGHAGGAAVATAPRDSVQTSDLPPPSGAAMAAPLAGNGAPSPGVDPLAAAPLSIPLRLPEQVTQGPANPGRLYVVCGTFSSAGYAYRQQAMLPGLPAHVERRLLDGQESDTLRVGPLAGPAEADRVLAQVLAAGINGASIIVENP